jgi:hypothetical protein
MMEKSKLEKFLIRKMPEKAGYIPPLADRHMLGHVAEVLIDDHYA